VFERRLASYCVNPTPGHVNSLKIVNFGNVRMLQRTCKQGRYRSLLQYCKADLHVTRGLSNVKSYIKFCRQDKNIPIATFRPLAFFQDPQLQTHQDILRHKPPICPQCLETTQLWLNYALNMEALYSAETLVITLTIVT
jgi:hypothetical protein